MSVTITLFFALNISKVKATMSFFVQFVNLKVRVIAQEMMTFREHSLLSMACDCNVKNTFTQMQFVNCKDSSF